MSLNTKVKLLLTAGKALSQMTKSAGGVVGDWSKDVLAPSVSSFLSAMANGPHGLSKEFFELLRQIGDSRSKQEEERIIAKEVHAIKKTLADPDSLNVNKDKELLVRMVYCEMLGQHIDFGYVHALTMTQRQKLKEKKAGYLTAAIILAQSDPFAMMLVNSFIRDMNSDNFMSICGALECMAILLNETTIPAVVDSLIKLLNHPREHVRKKAILALHTCWKECPQLMDSHANELKRPLCDRNPSVMIASLPLLEELVQRNKAGNKDLVPSLVAIQKQIIEHRLPASYDHHRLPAPWAQCQILRILAFMGQDDRNNSQEMYEVISETIRRADIGTGPGYAVLYECIRTAALIYPHAPLLEQCAKSIGSFLTNEGNNLKYMGIDALSKLVSINGKYANEHQITVIDCLDDPDNTLQAKTLELLYAMANARNIVSIAKKLLQSLQKSKDRIFGRELGNKIQRMAERFAPNHEWYVHTMTNVFIFGGDMIDSQVSNELLRLVAEGPGEGEEIDLKFRIFTVNHFHTTLSDGLKKSLVFPDIFLQVVVWTLGEYGHLTINKTAENIFRLLCDLYELKINNETKNRIVCAILKLVGKRGPETPLTAGESVLIDGILRALRSSRSTDLQQRAYEITNLLLHKDILSKCFVEKEKLQNQYVSEALENGAKPYIPKEERIGNDLQIDLLHDNEENEAKKGLRFDAYPTPDPEYKMGSASWVDEPTPIPSESISQIAAKLDSGAPTSTIAKSHIPSTRKTGIRTTRKKWGAEGYGEYPVEEEHIEPPMEEQYDTNVETVVMDSPTIDAIPAENVSNTHVDAQIAQPKVVAKADEEKQIRAHRLFGDTEEEEREPVPKKKQSWTDEPNYEMTSMSYLTPSNAVHERKPLDMQSPSQRAGQYKWNNSGMEKKPLSEQFSSKPKIPAATLGEPTISSNTVTAQSTTTVREDADSNNSTQSTPKLQQDFSPKYRGEHMEETTKGLPLTTVVGETNEIVWSALALSVQEYGQMWKSYKCEKRTQFSNLNTHDPAEVATKIKNNFNFQLVSIIKGEGIFAAKVLLEGSSVVVLLHIKVVGNIMGITLRCPNENAASACFSKIVNYIKTALIA